MKVEYDICVVSFSDIRFDGRSRNLIEALINLNKKIIVFSLTPINPFEKKIEHITIKTNYNRRVLFRWFMFNKAVKRHLKNIKYEIYWAADLYSLVCGNRYLIYDSREIYSALSVLHSSPIRQKIVALIERYYIKNIKILITSGKRDSDYVKEKYSLDVPVYEICNYPKYSVYANSNTIRERLNINEDKIVLLYQGVLLPGRGLIPVMEAIKDDTKYVLVVLGEGTFVDKLKEYATKLNIADRTYFVGNIEYNDLHNWTCSADIGLCNIEPLSLSYQFALPNKLFEYILAELPVLATDLPALKEVVNRKLGVIISQNNNEKEIITALNDLALNKNIYKENIKNVKNNYVYESQYELIKTVVCTSHIIYITYLFVFFN